MARRGARTGAPPRGRRSTGIVIAAGTINWLDHLAVLTCVSGALHILLGMGLGVANA